LLSIIVIWSLARIYPAIKIEPRMGFEIWQAYKLLDYGFWARHGATLGMGSDTGILPNPDAFNYTHHPFAIMWLYALIYALSGPWAVVVLLLALRLATCVLVFLVLDRHFNRFSAWCATVLFCLAPCSMHLANEIANATSLAAILWPLGALLVLGALPDSSSSPGARPRFLGSAVFLAGQMDWFAWTLIPPLLILGQRWLGCWRKTLAAAFRNPICIRILVGAGLTILALCLQVLFYERDYHTLVHHITAKAGANKAAVSRPLLFLLVPVRSLLWVGAPLLIGAVVGLCCCRRQWFPLVGASLAYVGVWALTACALAEYFVAESSIYNYLLFPAAVLTAVALEQRGRFLPWILLALCLPGILEIHLYASIPQLSETSKVVARFIADNSAKSDAIATNLEPGSPPYKASDVMAVRATRVAADRNIQFAFQTAEGLAHLPVMLKRTNPPALFFLDTSRPVAPDLLEKLHREGKVINRTTLSLPARKLNMPEKIRAFVFYRLMRKHKPHSTPGQQQTAGEENFEIYSLP